MPKYLLTTALAACLSALPTLATAQSSKTVRAAQQTLKDKGFDPGPVDGIDGPRTQSAVRSFQEKQNLAPDGKLGAQTLDSLGVKPGDANTDFHESGENLKSSYATGGKEIGKGIGHGAAKIGAGTGHAAVNAVKGVKNAVTGDHKSTEKK